MLNMVKANVSGSVSVFFFVVAQEHDDVMNYPQEHLPLPARSSAMSIPYFARSCYGPSRSANVVHTISCLRTNILAIAFIDRDTLAIEWVKRRIRGANEGHDGPIRW
jgi:hypothetical protein